MFILIIVYIINNRTYIRMWIKKHTIMFAENILIRNLMHNLYLN
jgi:hypothetical protein